MKIKNLKILPIIILISLCCTSSFGESLFKTGVSQNVYSPQPRPLFASIKAKSVGDLVTVVIANSVTSSDQMSLSINKTSTTIDNFSGLINGLLPINIIPKAVNGYGGAYTDSDVSSVSRATKFNDTITAQVIQILPNGNLVIQGKKTAINSGERVEIVLSGIIDPRFLDINGQISSTLVANLQMAVNGNGTISRSGSESTVGKILRYLF